MLKHRITISLASLAVVATGAVVVAAGAQAADSVVPIRKADFVTGLSDTRATGHVDFLREGVRVYTESNTSTDKAAEYFAMGPALPTSGSYEWFGTTNQPGAQIVFDVDATSGNGNDNNILVGEQIYSTNPAGQPITDWWYTNGPNGQSAADKAASRGITCPSTQGGSGSNCHGTLAQWAAAVPAARVYAGGFSLGSGVKGDGVLRALTFGDTTYEFTSQAAAEPTTAPGTTTPTTAPSTAPTATATATARPTPTAVTGSATVKARKRAVVRLTTAVLPAGAVEGAKLRFTVRVDRKIAADLTMGAGESNKVVRRFDKRSGKHVVEVFQGSKRVARGVVRR